MRREPLWKIIQNRNELVKVVREVALALPAEDRNSAIFAGGTGISLLHEANNRPHKDVDVVMPEQVSQVGFQRFEANTGYMVDVAHTPEYFGVEVPAEVDPRLSVEVAVPMLVEPVRVLNPGIVAGSFLVSGSCRREHFLDFGALRLGFPSEIVESWKMDAVRVCEHNKAGLWGAEKDWLDSLFDGDPDAWVEQGGRILTESIYNYF